MRSAFHDELDDIRRSLVEMTSLVGAAISRATRALLDVDLPLAEQVIADDGAVDALRTDLEERAFDLMARQQPVASDLRFLVTSLRIVTDLERMADLAVHVAKAVRRRFPAPAVPQRLRSTFAEMGRVAERMASQTAHVLAVSDLAAATTLEGSDDEMDALQRQTFTELFAPGWRGTAEEAVDVAMLGRSYERFADHAVSIARRVRYRVSGVRPRPVAGPVARTTS